MTTPTRTIPDIDITELGLPEHQLAAERERLRSARARASCQFRVFLPKSNPSSTVGFVKRLIGNGD
jgi:hypothetical protein